MINAYPFFRLGELMQEIRAGSIVRHAYSMGLISSVGSVSHGLSLRQIQVKVGDQPLDLQKLLPSEAPDQQRLEPALRDTMRRSLRELLELCRSLHLKMSARSAVVALGQLDDETATLRSLRDDCQEIATRLQDELTESWCYMVEPGHVEFLIQPHPFSEAVAKRFPETVIDIEEAGKCLAFDRATACVFHLMRVLEVGLQEFAKDLGLERLERNWQTLLNGIRGAVNALPRSTESEKRHHAQRSAILAHLQAVKDAWRNEVMHPRQNYTAEQATDIWNHTKALMRDLSEVL